MSHVGARAGASVGVGSSSSSSLRTGERNGGQQAPPRSMDRFSPIAPATIRVVVLSCGGVEKQTFHDFVFRLQREAAVISLADVASDSDSDGLPPSKNFPGGALFFNFTTSAPQDHEQLAEFELFRRTLLVVGVASSNHAGDSEDKMRVATQQLKERHPHATHRQILILHEGDSVDRSVSHNAIRVASAYTPNDRALRGAVDTLAARFLNEFAIYARGVRVSPNIETPGGQTTDRPSSIQIDLPHRDSTSAPSEPEVTSPIGEEPDASSRPPSQDLGSPPSGTNTPRRAIGLSQSKFRDRGKACVGIVLGHIHLMAGQWKEAMRILVEHTEKIKNLSDSVWFAKGLDGVVICLLLLAYAGVEFEIPALCYPQSERASGHAKRFSVNLPQNFRPAKEANEASVRRLGTSLPGLIWKLVTMYGVTDPAVRLLTIVKCDVCIRLGKLLAILHLSGGELSADALRQIVGGHETLAPKRFASSMVSKTISATSIAQLLQNANPVSDLALSHLERVAILAGIASVYFMLQQKRRHDFIMRQLIIALTSALNQARTSAAAEMGVHPAASFSTQESTDTIRAIAEESGGVVQLMKQVADAYGVDLVPDDRRVTHDVEKGSVRSRVTPLYQSFGNAELKIDVLSKMIEFSSSSPDPQAVLHLTACLLKSMLASDAVSQEEQVHAATHAAQTLAAARQLGLTDSESDYHDPFLVRDVSFRDPEPGRASMKKREALNSISNVPDAGTNPLLYDPNARRGPVSQQKQCGLVCNETMICVVTLQNPSAVTLQVESLSLSVDDELVELQLASDIQPSLVEPHRLQEVTVRVCPRTCGTFQITGCRIKLAGYREQTFAIMSQPWTPDSLFLMKNIGQDARGDEQTTIVGGPNAAKSTTVEAVVVPSTPILQQAPGPYYPAIHAERFVLLHRGQGMLPITVRNITKHPAVIVAAVVDPERFASGDVAPLLVKVGSESTAIVKVQLLGATAGTTEVTVRLFYGRVVEDKALERVHMAPDVVRQLTVSIPVTVVQLLRATALEIKPLVRDLKDKFTLRIQLVNDHSAAVLFQARHDSTASGDCWSKAQLRDLILAPHQSTWVEICMPRWASGPQAGGDAVGRSDADTAAQLERRVQISCQCRSNGPCSTVDLMPLLLEQLEDMYIVRMQDLRIDVEVLGCAKAGSFVPVKVTLANSTWDSTPPLSLRLEADARQLTVNGGLTRVVPSIKAKSDATIEFAVFLRAHSSATIKFYTFAAGDEAEKWTSEREIEIVVSQT